jgi:hypothetical protein
MRRLGWAVGGLTAMLVLGTVAGLVLVPGFVESGFIGWLEVDLPLRLVMHVPFALTVAWVCLVGIGAAGWLRGWWPGLVRLEFAALTVAAAFVVAQLAAWRLIGWGFG